MQQVQVQTTAIRPLADIIQEVIKAVEHARSNGYSPNHKIKDLRWQFDQSYNFFFCFLHSLYQYERGRMSFKKNAKAANKKSYFSLSRFSIIYLNSRGIRLSATPNILMISPYFAEAAALFPEASSFR